MPHMKIIGLNAGEPTAFDGQYLVEYDPKRDGTDPDGNPMTAHIVTTPDPEKALDLPAAALLELWRMQDGFRLDGKPNRPLTAFSVEIE